MKEIEKKWIENRDLLVEMAEGTKDSQKVAFDLLDAYDHLTPDEKEVVNRILARWLISDDNTLRYDASFIISQRRLKGLAKDVQAAIEFLKGPNDPEKTYERKKLMRILEELSK